MAYSPTGILIGLSQAQLDTIKASAIAALTNGRWTTITGGQKTGSKQYEDPKQTLAEVRFAEQTNGTLPPRASKITQILTRNYCRRG